ncbi:MAG: hypothetical protein HS116_18140 [Planctomycetes bacterium]|nr:hypothetical protein [Planctomycetota bacterium]
MSTMNTADPKISPEPTGLNLRKVLFIVMVVLALGYCVVAYWENNVRANGNQVPEKLIFDKATALDRLAKAIQSDFRSFTRSSTRDLLLFIKQEEILLGLSDSKIIEKIGHPARTVEGGKIDAGGRELVYLVGRVPPGITAGPIELSILIDSSGKCMEIHWIEGSN